MNELFKNIALLTTGLVIGVVVRHENKSKEKEMLTIANSDNDTLIEFNQDGIRLFNPNDKLNAKVPILDLDAHSLEGERLLFVQSLLQV